MGDEPKTPLGEKLLAIRNRAIANGMQLKTEEEIMTNDKGPAISGAPTQEMVEKSLSNVACGVADYSDCEVLRAHIAAQQAEVDRLREALRFYADEKHVLVDDERSQDLADVPENWCVVGEWPNHFFYEPGDKAREALYPEQKGGV